MRSSRTLSTFAPVSVILQIARTLKHKWHWRRRKPKPVRLIKLIHCCTLIVLIASSFLHSGSAYPVASKKLAARTGTRITTTFASHQTDCDWRGRGGIVASSSSRPSSNEPPTTPAMTTATATAARNSHNHRDSGDSDSDIRNSTKSANDGGSGVGQEIQSRVHQRNDDYEEDLLTSALVQTVSLRCSAGQVRWEDPIGGLKISIHPSVRKPYRLCLENASTAKSVRILLEQSSASSSAGVSLLPILTSSDSKCYQMYSEGDGGGRADEPTVIYVEHSSESLRDGEGDVELQLLDDVDGDGLLINQNHLEDDFPHQDDGASPSPSTGSNGNTISLSYEIESFRGDGDPCTPCSEMEALRTYCTADAVARGSIVKINPANALQPQGSPPMRNQADDFDSIYVKSTFVVHQTQPLFTRYDSLSRFLEAGPAAEAAVSSSSAVRFNTNQPQRFESLRGDLYGGIIHHPSQCASSIGNGEDYLWMIKFRFGRPITDCVVYWDSWVQLVQKNPPDCPVSFG